LFGNWKKTVKWLQASSDHWRVSAPGEAGWDHLIPREVRRNLRGAIAYQKPV